MKLQLKYVRLREKILALETDVVKTESGNAAAGRRVRKAMQDLKKDAQAIRIEISEEFRKDKKG